MKNNGSFLQNNLTHAYKETQIVDLLILVDIEIQT